MSDVNESMLEEFKDLKKTIESNSKKNTELIAELKKNIKSYEKNVLEMSQKLLRIEKLTEILKGIKSTNENVEESLCNVLLAIRQNEYLQAWYPPQQGLPEMKVTGIHPSNFKKA